MKIYVIRHGQSTHNASPGTDTTPDPPLTALGREQAEMTAHALRDAGLGAVALYSSPHRRALETVSALHRALQMPPHILPDICEAGGLREHTGLCREEILRQWPGVTLDERITEAGWWTGGLSEEAEEIIFYRRAEQALSLLRSRHGDRADTILVVTHGRFGSGLVSTMLEHGPAGYHRYPFNNCGISRIDYDPHSKVAYAPPPNPQGEEDAWEAVRLLFHNQTSHLPPSHRT